MKKVTTLFMIVLILSSVFTTTVFAKKNDSLGTKVENTETLTHQGTEITIARDNFGVPHVYADTEEALFFGVGYAMAQDRLWQAEMSRLVSSGQMSEFNPTPGNVNSDKVVRRDGYTEEESMEQYQALPKYAQVGIASYVDGINFYIENTSINEMSPEFQASYGKKPELWSITDTLRIGQLMVRRFGELGGNELTFASLYQNLIGKYGEEEGQKVFDTLRWTGHPEAAVSIPAGETSQKGPKKQKNNKAGDEKPAKNHKAFPHAKEVGKQQEQEQQMKLDIEEQFGFPHKGGSNAWIVAPSQSENGTALLLGGPQMGFSVPQIAFEIGIYGAGYSSIGMAFAGAGPIPLIGRGKDFGWTTTTGSGDQVDTYLLEINPDNPDQYFYNGKWKDLEVRTETINVRGQAPQKYKVYRSVHGPVIHKDDKVAYAQKRSHWGQEMNTMVGFWGFNRANNINQFERAVREIATSHHFFYADQRGNIGYWKSGRSPIRPDGVDGRFPAAGDGSEEWVGMTSPEELPSIINPKQGYIANWNNLPAVDFVNTETLYGQTHRVNYIIDQIEQRDKMSFEDMEEINRLAGIVDLSAYHFKDLLLDYLNENSELSADVEKAAELVEEWDALRRDENNNGQYDDVGLSIFRAWMANVRSSVFAELAGIGGQSDDLLYEILLGDDAGIELKYDFVGERDLSELVHESLVNAIAGKDLDSWYTTTSKINFSQVGGAPVPAIFNMNRGTYNQILELSRNDVHSVNILPPGQSGDPRSPHYDDQRLMYANWEYKPMIFDLLKDNRGRR